MKKLVLILALMVLIPCSAFGLEMLNDSTMDGITGQAGVNIAMDDIQMFINIEKLAWIDCDGFDSGEGKGTCGGNGGALVLNNFQIDVLNINAITRTSSSAADSQTGGSGLGLGSTACGGIPLFYNYATSDVAAGCTLDGSSNQSLGLNNYHGAMGIPNAFVPHFLSIDVTDELPASTEGLNYWQNHSWTTLGTVSHGASLASGNTTIGGVLIGLPTVEIYINEMVFTPVYDGDLSGQPSTAANDDDVTWTGNNTLATSASFGTIYMKGITFTVLGGWVEIAPK